MLCVSTGSDKCWEKTRYKLASSRQTISLTSHALSAVGVWKLVAVLAQPFPLPLWKLLESWQSWRPILLQSLPPVPLPSAFCVPRVLQVSAFSSPPFCAALQRSVLPEASLETWWCRPHLKLCEVVAGKEGLSSPSSFWTSLGIHLHCLVSVSEWVSERESDSGMTHGY